MKVLINKCYGGFGYSDVFTDHIEALTSNQFVNSAELWDRANPFLVEEAIKFGLKEASGYCSDLKVENVPDGAQYSVGEYDGMEWIDQIWIEVTMDELRTGLSESQLNMVSQGCDVRLKDVMSD